MDFDELTEEQKAKAKACCTPEDVLALAREEGYELSEAELDGVVGGGWRNCGCDAQEPVPMCGGSKYSSPVN